MSSSVQQETPEAYSCLLKYLLHTLSGLNQMADTVDAATRSAIMRRIRSRDTKPELTVRRHLHRHGLRYRLHDKRLPGKPDLVLPRYGTVVFVHGCFWHQHPKVDCTSTGM